MAALVNSRTASGIATLLSRPKNTSKTGFNALGRTTQLPILALDFTNGNTLDPRITFTRGSNATVTDNNGNIAYAPHNLLTYSEQFDNAAWTKLNTTVSANAAVAPDGSTTADKLIASAVSGEHTADNAFTAVSGTTYTVSAYVQAAGLTDVGLRFTVAASWTGSTSPQVRFNLVDQSMSVVGGTPSSYSITSAGTGRYRISMSVVCIANGTPSARIQLMSGPNNVFTGDGTSGIYIWGAQLNVGALQPYYPTTSDAYYGPRFDYDPVTLQPKGLLIEEQRTNLLTYSEQFDNAAWVASRVTVSPNTGISPAGTPTADKVIPSVSSIEFKELQQNFNATSGVTYVFSQYVKNDGYNFVQLIGVGSVFGTFYVNYNLTTGQETAFSASNSTVVARGIQPLGNGWYRVFAAVTALSTSNGARLAVNIIPSATAVRGAVWEGDGTSGVLYWGAQLEAGSFPTSYIPTTSAQVTRAAEIPAMIGTNFSSWYNQSEGTFMVDADCITADPTGYYRVFSANNGVGWAEEITILCNASSNKLYATVTTGGVSQFDSGSVSSGNVTISANTPMRLALGYKANDFGASANGGSAAQDSVGRLPTAVQLRLGNLTGGDQLNGHIRRLAYWNRRLSNAELQGITS